MYEQVFAGPVVIIQYERPSFKPFPGLIMRVLKSLSEYSKIIQEPKQSLPTIAKE